MNKNRRKSIREAANYIGLARVLVENARDEEEIAFDNLPEGLQASIRGEQMEENFEVMNEIVDQLTEAQELVGAII